MKGIDLTALLGGALLLIFLIYALVDMPKKHKNFSYADQVKGMLQSYGGNPPPEAPTPGEIEEAAAAKMPVRGQPREGKQG